MELLEFDDYRVYLAERVRSMPSRGKGQMKILAEKIGVHPSLLSQVMGGSRELTLEQACGIAEAFGMSDVEMDYFLLLVEKARAESERLRRLVEKRITKFRAGLAGAAPEKPVEAKGLSESDRAVFYSNWYYSAIRLRSAITPYPSIDILSHDLNLPIRLVRQVTEFLVQKGLCVEKNGRIQIGPNRTWIDSSSPLVTRHHQNWRMKGMDQMPKKGRNETFLTLPMAIGEKDLPKVSAALQEFEKKVLKIIDQSSKAESLVCLNVDWFRFS